MAAPKDDISVHISSPSLRKGRSDSVQDIYNPLGKNNGRSIYVIYTGGTLGMNYGEDGLLAPEPEYLTKQLKTLPDFNTAQMPQFTINEWNPILDSSDMAHPEWARLAREIEEKYYDYDGFVVLHGTDTMSYTASALSFMLENLGKPVILTGSSIPFCEAYNDARRNLIVAFLYASLSDICEVCVFYNNALMRGNRSRKVSIRDLNAFHSFNFPPLGTLGVNMTLKRDLLLTPPKRRFRVHTDFNQNIAHLRLTPGFNDDIVRNMLQPPIQGLILEIYGAGNAPSKKSLHDVLQEAEERGVILVILSQCMTGYVNMSEYKSGSVMKEVGAVSGYDMTPEACATKLAYLLGKDLPVHEVKRLMTVNLRGELTTDYSRDFMNTIHRDTKSSSTGTMDPL
eukprot:comp9306_c0_seq1/m.4397 comp9306_c0_seq1/g.4397  ORF comp9306_c0_seq1/g.4397 comp9306_c0_seq1/m.4397 type:complete len:397 (-) comp9306_c0_seq1:31-1221(-)